MKNIIQKLTKLVALSAYLIAYSPAFADTPQADQEQQGGIFDTNEECPWHFGVKMWEKLPIKLIKRRFALGCESAVGPFVEWKPLNGIGVQTGVMYTYNYLATIGKDASDSSSIDCDLVKLRAISIPLSIRFYPGSDRQFVIHIGPRLMIPFKAKQLYYENFGTTDSELSFINKLVKAWEALNSDQQTAADLKIGPHLTWDWGFAYNTKSGFMIGMNGLGPMLGFDGSKLLTN